LLVLLLPGIWLAGRELARRTVSERSLAQWLAPIFGTVIWLLAVHCAGRLFHSFWAGLWVGTLTAGVAGYGAWRLRRFEGEPDATGSGASKWLWLTGGLSTLALAPAALGWAFHDQTWITGHLAIGQEMLNGVYPPRHLNFPQFELRYHYGVDLLSAMLAALLRIRLDHALDAAVLLLWFQAWGLAWCLGERWLGTGRGWLTSCALLLGGNLALLGDWGGCQSSVVERLLGTAYVNGESLCSPVVSFFFQAPWALGLPITLAALLVFSHGKGWWRGITLGLLIAALSLSQIVLFLTVGAAMACAEFFPNERWLPLGAWRLVLALGVALACSWWMGGFWAPKPEPGVPDVAFQPGFLPRLGGNLLWHGLSLGLLLPLGAAGMLLLRQGREVVVLMLALSLGILNFCYYPGSGDVVKFAVVAKLALALPTAAALGWLIHNKGTLRTRTLAGAMLAVLCAGGISFLGAVGADPPGMPGSMAHALPGLDEDDARAVQFLRTRLAPGEVVYRQRDTAVAYAVWGGLPQACLDRMSFRWGFTLQRMLSRLKLVAFTPDDPIALPADSQAYRDEGLCWFVLEASDTALDRFADDWLRRGQAELAAEFGRLRIVHLLPETDTGVRAKDDR
jgi:hypothetical protein